MDRVELLKKIPIFQGLGEATLRKLAQTATEETVLPGATIFLEGSVGDSLFIVKYGTVRVLKSGKHDEEEVARMGQGQYFGEVALIDSDQRSATVAAVERTELLRVDRQELEKVLNQDSAVGLKVYRAFARSLCRRLRQTTIDLTFMKDLAKQHSSPG